jgi:hypothetical protein
VRFGSASCPGSGYLIPLASMLLEAVVGESHVDKKIYAMQISKWQMT